MAYVVGNEEFQKEFVESLQSGDYVRLLGKVYKWEASDSENYYGEDLKAIPLIATTMLKNGFNFDLFQEIEDTMKRSYKGDYIVSWNPKTRNLTYTHGAFRGGIEKVDTVDKLQRSLRIIGLKEAADNFKLDD